MHLTLMHEDHAIGDLACKADLMGNHHQRHAILGETFDDAQNFSNELQLLGTKGADAAVLALGREFEQNFPLEAPVAKAGTHYGRTS